MARLTLHRRHLLAALTVAYPATFALLSVRPYCDGPCPGFGTVDVLALLAVLVGSWLLALAATALVERSGLAGHPAVVAARSPSNATVVVLASLFLAFVGFLVLDAVDGPASGWKLVVLPASFVPLAPAWLLYAGTFYVAAVTGVLGLGSSPTLTLVVRATVVVVGFGATPAWQYLLVEGVVGRLGGRAGGEGAPGRGAGSGEASPNSRTPD